MAHLIYRPYSNQIKTATPSDFDNIRARFNSADFSKIIPNLCLADLFLIEFCKTDSWRNGIIALNAFNRLYSCNFCNKLCQSGEDLINHLKSKKHGSNIQDGSNRYYHPVFTYTIKHLMLLNENEIDPKVASQKLEDELYQMSRLTFLCAHLTAKIFEDEMVSKGITLPEYTIAFSGRKIVANASKMEFDEAVKILQSDAIQNLEQNKLTYNHLLSQIEKKGRTLNEISKAEEDKINFTITMIKLLSKEHVIPDNRFIISSLIDKSNMEDEPDIGNTKTQTTSHSDSNRRDLDKNASSTEVIASSSPDLVLVLRLLAGLEDDLGSLGPKIIDLLSHTLAIIRKSKNKQPLSEVLTFENCILIKTATEKLKGLSEILQGSEEAKVEIMDKVMSKATELLKYAPNWEVPNKPVSNEESIKSNQNKFGQSESNFNSTDRTLKQQYHYNEDINMGISPTHKEASMHLDNARFIAGNKNDNQNISQHDSRMNHISNIPSLMNIDVTSNSFIDSIRNRNSGSYKSASASYFQQSKPYPSDDHRQYRSNLSRQYGASDILRHQERNY